MTLVLLLSFRFCVGVRGNECMCVCEACDVMCVCVKHVICVSEVYMCVCEACDVCVCVCEACDVCVCVWSLWCVCEACDCVWEACVCVWSLWLCVCMCVWSWWCVCLCDVCVCEVCASCVLCVCRHAGQPGGGGGTGQSGPQLDWCTQDSGHYSIGFMHVCVCAHVCVFVTVCMRVWHVGLCIAVCDSVCVCTASVCVLCASVCAYKIVHGRLWLCVCMHVCVYGWLWQCVWVREREIRIWYHTCATLAVSAHGRYTPPVLTIITLLIGLQLDLGGLSQPALQ